MAKSYFARYRSKSGKPLICGMRESSTARYETAEMAQSKLDNITQQNKGNCVGEIVGDDAYPEVFIHCDNVITTIGAYCAGCRNFMTTSHAKEKVGIKTDTPPRQVRPKRQPQPATATA